MSRHEGDFRASAEAKLDLVELLSGIRWDQAERTDRSAILARFLSGSDGWRDAGLSLGGAFAGPTTKATGLTRGKEE